MFSNARSIERISARRAARHSPRSKPAWELPMTARAFNMARHRATISRYVMTSGRTREPRLRAASASPGRMSKTHARSPRLGPTSAAILKCSKKKPVRSKCRVLRPRCHLSCATGTVTVSTLNCSCRSRCRCLIGNGRTTGSIPIWPTRPSEQVKRVASGHPRE